MVQVLHQCLFGVLDYDTSSTSMLAVFGAMIQEGLVGGGGVWNSLAI